MDPPCTTMVRHIRVHCISNRGQTLKPSSNVSETKSLQTRSFGYLTTLHRLKRLYGVNREDVHGWIVGDSAQSRIEYLPMICLERIITLVKLTKLSLYFVRCLKLLSFFPIHIIVKFNSGTYIIS
jgi:hypothetical protein